MKIIKNGKEKIFYHMCHYCATEFEYILEDTNYHNAVDKRFIECPVCKMKQLAGLLNKEELMRVREYELVKNKQLPMINL